jgi:hypothetical protein
LPAVLLHLNNTLTGCRESSAPTPSSIRYRRLRAGECDDEFESVTTCNLIVMELCRMGNLRQALNKGLLHKQVAPGRLTVRMELLLLVSAVRVLRVLLDTCMCTCIRALKG